MTFCLPGCTERTWSSNVSKPSVQTAETLGLKRRDDFQTVQTINRVVTATRAYDIINAWPSANFIPSFTSPNNFIYKYYGKFTIAENDKLKATLTDKRDEDETYDFTIEDICEEDQRIQEKAGVVRAISFKKTGAKLEVLNTELDERERNLLEAAMKLVQIRVVEKATAERQKSKAFCC